MKKKKLIVLNPFSIDPEKVLKKRTKHARKMTRGEFESKLLTLKQIKEQLNYGDITECARQFGCSAQTVHNVLNAKSRHLSKYIYAWLNERALENMKIPKK
jgi:hypothetical protein